MAIVPGQTIAAADVLGALALNLPLSGGTLTGALTLFGAPTLPLHAATKAYIDAINTTTQASLTSLNTTVTGSLQKSGGTMTADLILFGDPPTTNSAARKAYVDNSVAANAGTTVLKTGGTMTGDLVLFGDPATTSSATRKSYVDAANATNATAAAAAQTTATAAMPKSGGTFTGDVIAVATPAGSTSIVRKSYVDAGDAAATAIGTAAQTTANAALPLTGGTMTGDLKVWASPAGNTSVVQKVYVDSAVATNTAALTANNAVVTATPVTGFTTTIPAACNLYLMTPAGTLASGSLTMPVTPATGAKQTVRISTSQTITALTLSANTGQTISSPPTTLAANTSVEFVISGSNWFRLL